MNRPTAIILSGFFSPLHAGHLDMIEAAADAGDLVIVIVNNNEQQISKKGQIIVDEQIRLRIVKALRMVDDAFIAIDHDRTVSASLALAADKYADYRLVFANGGDRKSGEVVPETDVCREHGIEMVFDMGGNDKADSSTRINMLIGAETEPSALPSSDS